MYSEPQKFKTTIFKVGINPAVNVPKGISNSFNQTGYIPVKGNVNGYRFKSTLVPIGQGSYRLYINREMLKGADAQVGAPVEIWLQKDFVPRIVIVPDDLVKALKSVDLYDKFMDLTPSRRKDMIVYLNYVKKPVTRKRTIAKIVRLTKKFN